LEAVAGSIDREFWHQDYFATLLQFPPLHLLSSSNTPQPSYNFSSTHPTTNQQPWICKTEWAASSVSRKTLAWAGWAVAQGDGEWHDEDHANHEEVMEKETR
jgi:hypothetical protein